MIHARKIELLAPAKNAEFGMEAILHGADAVYIGAPKFGARASAANNLEDICILTEFAHRYYARVYVALNTILSDDELKEAETLIHELYAIGVDALIIQDMGILELDLPPISLHASTQMDNRTVEKAQFLEKAGFSQIVLARELSLEQVFQISTSITTPIEVFVHGALCVSYSGQCYLSCAMSGRSANRGNCSQACRLPYDLVDDNGVVISSAKHLLSMKDLNQSENLEEILAAGASSLKIEGRLKDLTYLKNVVAYYRLCLDKIMKKHPEYIRTSSGITTYSFIPDLNKTFNRGFTNYFLHNRTEEKVWSPDSPKSLGEFVGTVADVTTQFIRINGKVKINNGDGLCFFNHKNLLVGMQINRVDGDTLYPFQKPVITRGTKLYRNNDHEFDKQLSKNSAERKIKAEISLKETEDGFSLQMEDEDGNLVFANYPLRKELAQKDQTANIKMNLSKTGQTIFRVENVEVQFSENRFIPASVLSQLRRDIVEKLMQVRIQNFVQEKVEHHPTDHPFPEREITYLGNVANEKAKRFYERHHSEVVESAFEIDTQNNVPLMFTRHCIKHSLGWCPKENREKLPYKEPFFLKYGNTKFRLEFDCEKCEMRVYKE